MRYPVFKQWLLQLEECKVKSKNSLIDTTRTVTIGNQVIKVTIGKSDLNIRMNDVSMWAKELRQGDGFCRRLQPSYR